MIAGGALVRSLPSRDQAPAWSRTSPKLCFAARQNAFSLGKVSCDANGWGGNPRDTPTFPGLPQSRQTRVPSRSPQLFPSDTIDVPKDFWPLFTESEQMELSNDLAAMPATGTIQAVSVSQVSTSGPNVPQPIALPPDFVPPCPIQMIENASGAECLTATHE